MNATVPLPSDPASVPKKGSSGKLIALIVGICLFLFVAFVGGILFFVFSLLRSNGAYQGALERARKSPEAIVAIGEPMEDGYFMSGNISTSNDSGRASLSIPLSGPKGKGTLRVEAVMQVGVWKFSRLDLVVGTNTIKLASVHGVVKSYNKEKAFGYITAGDGGKDIFVEQSDILEHGEPFLEEGQNVEYEVEDTEKGPKAVRVRVK